MKETILIIEDSDELRDNAKELLQLAGYKVEEAVNGKDGVEKALAIRPDLILCDVMMPLLDGYGVLRILSGHPELTDTAFIFLTARTDREDVRKGMELGADDYLEKPLEGDELLRAVQGRLKRRSEKRKSGSGNDSDVMPLSDEELSKRMKMICESCTVKQYRARDMVFMSGDTANHLYYIVEGRAKLYKTNDAGKEFIVSIRTPGEFFGHIALLEGAKHRIHAAAMDDLKVCLISKHDFMNMLNKDNRTALSMLRYIATNLEDAEERLVRMAYDSARKRVAEALILLAQKYNEDSDAKKHLPAFRENISAIAGISPESVSRNLTDFREEGLIETVNGEIVIPDLKKLSGIKG